jgi:hypothetical protein
MPSKDSAEPEESALQRLIPYRPPKKKIFVPRIRVPDAPRTFVPNPVYRGVDFCMLLRASRFPAECRRVS